MQTHLMIDDPEIAQLAAEEIRRIEGTLNLIAAENHSPSSVMETLGSVFNTKTIEGYPGKRFHAGCIHADRVERIAVERCRRLFNADYANVQPHSGTAANLAVYFSVLEVGDRILAMDLAHGGHLSHGHRASVTSRCFTFRHYGLNCETERIDYDNVHRLAVEFRPKMIVAGASSYPQLIDYEKMAEISRDVSAYLFSDMAHIAGLVAAGTIPSPVPHCDFVTFTCYKTLMGGRGGVILARKHLKARIDRAVFPGCQGTSAVNSIAAKAVIFKLAMTPEFVRVQKNTLSNAVCLADGLMKRGYRIVTGGTGNHQVLVDVGSRGISGGEVEAILESVGIIANRNVIPHDAGDPGKVSGIRLGTAAVTTRGMGLSEMEQVAELIHRAVTCHDQPESLEAVSRDVKALCRRFPVYP